jgi:hypothetical protein
MRAKLISILILLAFLTFQGCAEVRPTSRNRGLIPLQKANLEAVFAENEGLEVTREDAKDVRDFYRGGVQQKAKAEKRYQEKAYQEALEFYQSSNYFLSKLSLFIRGDSAEYPLFKGTHILFFPDLLVADNYFKMGMIERAIGHEEEAQSCWKRSSSFVQKSLQSERTEWGLSLERKISNSLERKKN